MSRKIPRQVWRGGRKGSSRITTTSTSNANAQLHQKNKCYREEEGEAGPPSRTRARLKRKFQQQNQPPQQPIPAPPNTTNNSNQGRKKTNHQHQSNTNEGQQSFVAVASSSSVDQPLPQKQILQLVLDTLQRRDTYEIFAEPVDPNEVEDYYEIIKEPMDFGTMRAKLHEGMYTSLEQFERDIYLISENAMHFNSSTSIFFRQARAIHELSNKVFDLLRTDPQNFVTEYSGTRRRSSRRLQGEEAKKLNHSKAIAIHSADARIDSTAVVDASLMGAQNCGRAQSIFRTPRARDFGSRDGRRCSSSDEVDRRCTYKPMVSQGYSSFYLGGPTNSKTLISLQQQEGIISYRESLMGFAKDLGPTAKMIANKKLQGLLHTSQQAPKLALYDPFLKTRPSTWDISQQATDRKQARNVSDLTNAIAYADGEVVTNIYKEILSAGVLGLDYGGDFVLSKFRDCASDLCYLKTKGNSSLLSSDTNTDGCSKQSSDRLKREDKTVSVRSRKDSSQENSLSLMEESPRVELALTSSFAFDLPFLKSRLSQMKFTSNHLQPKPKLETRIETSPEPMMDHYNDKIKTFSFAKKLELQNGWRFTHNNIKNNPDSDLALQL